MVQTYNLVLKRVRQKELQSEVSLGHRVASQLGNLGSPSHQTEQSFI